SALSSHSLHDALPICPVICDLADLVDEPEPEPVGDALELVVGPDLGLASIGELVALRWTDRDARFLEVFDRRARELKRDQKLRRSEEHTSELQSRENL